MPSISFTVTAGEAARVTAAAIGYGFPDAKTMIIQNVKDAVAAWEQSQAVQAVVPSTPIAPT